MKLSSIILLFYVSTLRSEELSTTPGEPHLVNELMTEDNRMDSYATSGEKLTDSEEKVLENYDYSRDDVVNQQGLITTFNMIKQGDEEISRHQNYTKNTILLLGNAGAGKTTFAQLVAGDNSKLESKEVETDSGEYIIEDGVKIGTSAIDSFTLYPEQLAIDSTSSVTDTPGFSDTRSPKHELVASYVTKKYLNNIDNIKVVLLVTYNSVQFGLYKDDFVNLIKNVNSFIKDIEKYKHSIVLVATKVPNTYKTVNDSVTLIPDEKVIKNIARYLLNVQISIEKKLEECNDDKEKHILQKSISLLKQLQELDPAGKNKRINIFRRPSEAGALSKMPEVQQGKQSLLNTLDNINYTKVYENEIGYSLSFKAKNYLNCLFGYINENIGKISAYTFHSIKNYNKEKFDNYTDVFQLRSDLESLLKKFKLLKNNLKRSENINKYLSVLSKFISDENIPLNKTENEAFFDMHNYVSNLQRFTNSGAILSPLEWSEETRTLIEYFKEHLSWYDYLIKMFKYFSAYEIQKTRDVIYDSKNFNKNVTDALQIMVSHFDTSLFRQFNSYLNFTLSNNRKSELQKILSMTLEKNTNITCDKNEVLAISDYYVKTSAINKDLIKTNCGGRVPKVIAIYGINTVFIDADLDDEFYKGINLMIAAPRWEIIGSRVINIDGSTGTSHNKSRADDGDNFGESGKNGLPGLPGGNGGNFLGIGINFVNEENLVINASGGKGGPGQDGGNGKIGENGKDGYKKFYQSLPSDTNYNSTWSKGTKSFPYLKEDKGSLTEQSMISHSHCSSKITWHAREGDCGKIGGAGGYGGVGGIGGNGGSILLIGDNILPKFSLRNISGLSGNPGKGGIAGMTGSTGASIYCAKITVTQSSGKYYDQGSSNFWKCETASPVITICPEISAANGLTNFEKTDIQLPLAPQVYDFSSVVYSYTLLLKTNEDNKFLSGDSHKFKKLIYRKISLMKNNFWRFIPFYWN